VGCERHEFLRNFQCRWYSWWVARVSIPAPWDSSQNVRRRPSLFVWPGQKIMQVRRRLRMFSRMCFPGCVIGYTAPEVGFPALFKSRVPMDSK
jgi:hypothetical protein